MHPFSDAYRSRCGREVGLPRHVVPRGRSRDRRGGLKNALREASPDYEVAVQKWARQASDGTAKRTQSDWKPEDGATSLRRARSSQSDLRLPRLTGGLLLRAGSILWFLPKPRISLQIAYVSPSKVIKF